MSSKETQGTNPQRGFLPMELTGISRANKIPPPGFPSLGANPQASKLARSESATVTEVLSETRLVTLILFNDHNI